MDLHACFRVMVICMLTLNPGFGLNITCQSEWEEYSEVSCRCVDDSGYLKFTWYLYSGTQTTLASADCPDYMGACNPKSPQFSAFRYGSYSLLTIPSVTVDMATLECAGVRGNSVTFKLPVFARPLKPVCQEPYAVNRQYVHLSCHSNSVFPEGVCRFNVMEDLDSMKDKLKLNTSNTLSNGKYLTVCVLTIPLELLRTSNGFQVGVTPNVSAAENVTVYSDWTYYSYYAAYVSEFTINSESELVSVDLGQPIVFKCLTEGQPVTNVSIIKTTQVYQYYWEDKTLFQKATYELSRTIEAATCDDGGNYVCNAFNGFNHRSSDIVVQVRGDLQLDPSSVLKYHVDTSYQASKFKFKVYGCPEPTSFSLTNVVGDNSFATVVGVWLYTTTFSYPLLTLSFLYPAPVLEVGKNRLTLTVRNGVDELQISFDVQFLKASTDTGTVKDDNGNGNTDSPSDSGANVSGTASAIGIAFGCLIVLGICIVAIMCYRHKRKKSLTRRPPPVYFHSMNGQTQGTDTRYTSPEPATNVPNTTEEQRWGSSTLPDVIFTTRASSEPTVEIMTTNDDTGAYHNFRLPPSYETVVHNDGYSATSVPEAPPPSYASVQAQLDLPPPYYTEA